MFVSQIVFLLFTFKVREVILPHPVDSLGIKEIKRRSINYYYHQTTSVISCTQDVMVIPL